MEYLLFAVGTALIIISLILTYRADNKQDSYYIESELLSKIQEIQQEIEEKFEPGEFDQLLEANRGNEQLLQEVKAFQQEIGQIDNKLDKIEEKLNKLEGKLTDLAVEPLSEEVNDSEGQTAQMFQPEKYQEIKELVEEGLSTTEIARELEMGNREIELIWKLNKRGGE